MNELTTIIEEDPVKIFRRQGGMTPAEAGYMRGNVAPAAGSVPMSTSKYLNSALFRHAFSQMSLRRLGTDVACTWDIPDMTRGIADVTDYVAAARAIAAEREKNPVFDAWVAERRTIVFDEARLARCAPGTLGHAAHEFITASGMNIKFVHNFDAQSDYEFLMRSMGHSHDLQHILTGFGPNQAGEIALAFMNITVNARQLSPALATEMSINNNFISSAAVARTFFNYPEGVPLLLEAIERGIAAGRTCTTPLFMFDYAAYFDWQLDDIARHLGFERGPGAQWDYSEALLAG